MKTPILSVIIPIYNAENSIKQITSHVLNQSMKDLELILIDDGSADNSLQVIQEIAKSDNRVKILTQKNSGASSARNAGIEIARGKYLMFLDADDNIDSTMIQKMTDKIQTEGTDLVTCGIKYFTVKNGQTVSEIDTFTNKPPQKSTHESLTKYVVRLLGTDGRLYNPSNKIFRTDLIKKHNVKFQIGLNFGEDLTFNLHYLKYAQKIAFINEPLYHYYFDAEHGTFGKSSLIYENRVKNFTELTKFAGKNPDNELKDLLNWIEFYWFYAFLLALSNASISHEKRLQFLKNGIKLSNLTPAKSPTYIGKKKLHIEKIIHSAARTPRLLLVLTKILNFAKHNKISARLWQKVKTSSMS